MQAQMAVSAPHWGHTREACLAAIPARKWLYLPRSRSTLTPDLPWPQGSHTRWLDWSRRGKLCDTDDIVGRSFCGASG